MSVCSVTRFVINSSPAGHRRYVICCAATFGLRGPRYFAVKSAKEALLPM